MMLRRFRVALACLGLLYALPVLAANPKSAPRAESRAAQKAAAKPAKKVRAPASTAGKKAVPQRTTSRAAGKATSSAACTTQRVKTASGWKTRKVCAGARAPAAEAPSLRSPIAPDSLARPVAASGAEIKVRTAPDRAYAVDGATFFYQGRKYRVQGLKAADNSDMAKQRLQRSLEAGSLAVMPVRVDEAGVSVATVRVNGRDIADDLY
ncbi:MAG: hypothetical protein REI09_07295 [Candidatus Dactylopiibacterium sp.]|nr:hypothetical protein [Candidatus Dactylopiibacterium sp.]